MTRKNVSRASAADAKQRALDAAAQVVPMAKSAGIAAKSTAEDAVAWATPHVQDARSWAAPHVEQAGLAVRDKIGPTISSALVEAAHRIDSTPPRRRRWPRVLAGIAMLAAAGSAVAAIVLRRQPETMNFGTEGQATDDATPTSGKAERSQANGASDEVNARTNKS